MKTDFDEKSRLIWDKRENLSQERNYKLDGTEDREKSIDRKTNFLSKFRDVNRRDFGFVIFFFFFAPFLFSLLSRKNSLSEIDLAIETGKTSAGAISIFISTALLPL